MLDYEFPYTVYFSLLTDRKAESNMGLLPASLTVYADLNKFGHKKTIGSFVRNMGAPPSNEDIGSSRQLPRIQSRNGEFIARDSRMPDTRMGGGD